MLANQFTEAFRNEHRQLRDTLLALTDALEGTDLEAIQQGIEEFAAYAGPHFHYEGEALYPALAELHGDEYVEQLQAEHDRTLAAAAELAALSEAEELTSEQADRAIELIAELLPHVSERDGLSVIVEVLPRKQVESILKSRKSAKAGKITLPEAVKHAKNRRRVKRASGKASAQRKAQARKGAKAAATAKSKIKLGRKTRRRAARAK